MTITSALTTGQGQSVLAQYQLAARTAALQRLASGGASDTAAFGTQAQSLADIAGGGAGSADSGTADLIDRLPADPGRLARLAQQMDRQAARLKQRGRTAQATSLGAFADAVRQRATALTNAAKRS